MSGRSIVTGIIEKPDEIVGRSMGVAGLEPRAGAAKQRPLRCAILGNSVCVVQFWASAPHLTRAGLGMEGSMCYNPPYLG
jgi:hypothetical protein